MLEALPTELQEKICSLLDGTSLLRASCVSKDWNRIICGLQVVWKHLGLQKGFGPLAEDWKRHYVECVRLLRRLKNGTAFEHRHFAPKCFRCSDVKDVVFWNGCILAGIHDCIRVWKVEDLKPVAVFDVPYEVSHLNVSLDGSVMGVGHYNGIITTWLLHEVDVVMVNLLQEYVGHTDNILCLCVAPEIDLMCSGSRDRTIKLWCLGTGQLLRTLPASGWVAQVTLVPAMSHNSVYEHRHALLAADQSGIWLYSWPVQCDSTYGDISIIHNSDLNIPVDGNASTRKFLVQGRHFIHIRDSTIVVQDLVSLVQVECFRADCDMLLLASGARYVLVTMWDSCAKHWKLAIVDISDGQLVGTYPMPFCREYVVPGDTEWLSGVSHHRPRHLVAAGWMMGVLHMNQLTDVLYLITWHPDES